MEGKFNVTVGPHGCRLDYLVYSPEVSDSVCVGRLAGERPPHWFNVQRSVFLSLVIIPQKCPGHVLSDKLNHMCPPLEQCKHCTYKSPPIPLTVSQDAGKSHEEHES